MDMLLNVVQRIMTSVSLDVIQDTSCTTAVPDPGHVHLMDGLETSQYVNRLTYIYSIYYFSYLKMQQGCVSLPMYISPWANPNKLHI